MTIAGVSKKKYFEFKSYSSVPPTDFAKQFIKDLSNTDIIDLKQLGWFFDAAKNPPNFTTNMKSAIDELPITIEQAQKFGFTKISDLKSKLKTDFDSIFMFK